MKYSATYVLLLGVAFFALWGCSKTYGSHNPGNTHHSSHEPGHVSNPGPEGNVPEFTFMPQRYYVLSDDPRLKAQYGVNHAFPGAFSTVLTEAQARALGAAGIRVEPVQLYAITPKPAPGCNYDGKCQGNEDPSCPDCASGGGGGAGGRGCFPDDQTPWGIEKVYGNTGIGSTMGGLGVKVAVLDTGVNIEHLDLAGRVANPRVDCADATTPRGIKQGSCNDGNGHGTHVSGTILADGGSDGKGVFGVAPDATLMAVRVCGGAFCWGDDIAAGMDYAVANGANIISMSLGGDLPDSQILAAIDDAVTGGVLVVAAAGNDGPDAGSIDYPGAYVKVVAAGAIDANEAVPSWSSRGVNDGDCAMEEREVEFGAPGVSVESTYKDGCYTYMSGTSMATPHVSGMAAKYWTGTAAGTRAALKGLARDIAAGGDDPATGFGLPTATMTTPTCP